MKEALDLANEYINELEDVELHRRLAVSEQYEHRAEVCGCPQCARDARIKQEDLEEEIIRVHLDTRDHEEEILANYAIEKLKSWDSEALTQ